jgi:hypothetical protein
MGSSIRRRFTQMIADQKDILPRIHANEHESDPKMSSCCGEILTTCDIPTHPDLHSSAQLCG